MAQLIERSAYIIDTYPGDFFTKRVDKFDKNLDQKIHFKNEERPTKGTFLQDSANTTDTINNVIDLSKTLFFWDTTKTAICIRASTSSENMYIQWRDVLGDVVAKSKRVGQLSNESSCLTCRGLRTAAKATQICQSIERYVLSSMYANQSDFVLATCDKQIFFGINLNSL